MSNTTAYDRAAEIIKAVLEECASAGVPDTAATAALGDIAIGIALRLGGSTAGEALVERMHGNVARWSMGTHEMQELMRSEGEDVAEPEELFRKHELDGSPLRIAMEHLLSHQRVKLEQAAAFFTVYALMLVFHNAGPAQAKAVLATARRELRRMESEAREKAAKSAEKRPPEKDSICPAERSARSFTGEWVH